jgi:hypothetical protein
MSVTGKRQKLGLEHVGGVTRVEGEELLALLPVPDDDTEVVRTGCQFTSALVEVSRKTRIYKIRVE